MIRRRKTALSLLVAAAMTMPVSAALSQSGHMDLPSVPGDSVYIWNGGNKDVTFYVSVDGQNWAKFRLGSDQSQLVNIQGAGDQATLAIRTGETVNKRTVKSKGRYKIYFDQSSGSWDVAALEPN